MSCPLESPLPSFVSTLHFAGGRSLRAACIEEPGVLISSRAGLENLPQEAAFILNEIKFRDEKVHGASRSPVAAMRVPPH